MGRHVRKGRKRKPRGGLGSYGAAVEPDAANAVFQKSCPLFGRATPLPSSVYFLRALPAPINKTPRPCRFSVFLHACSVPLRWGERAFFWSFPGGSPAAPHRAPPSPAPGLPRRFAPPAGTSPARIRATGMKKERQNAVLPRFWLQNTKKCDRI